MIEEIRIKNVLSFRDEVELSFEADSNETGNESAHVVTMPNGMRLLRLAIIIGANASGKSNLLKAISGFYHFMFHEPKNMDSRIAIEPFLLDTETPSQPSEFSIKFWVGETRYWYQLSVTRNRVLSEKLSYYKTTQPVFLFDRQLEDGQSVLRFNPKVQNVSSEEQKALSLYCLPNMSFFAARGKVNIHLDYIDEAREWLVGSIMPVITPGTSLMDYGSRMYSTNEGFKEHLLEFLRGADFNISGLSNITIEQPIPERVRETILADDSAPEDLKKHLMEHSTLHRNTLRFQHTVKNTRGTETYELKAEQQSDGTRRAMGIEAAVYEAAKSAMFLPIDELETSLHPDLFEFVIRQFINSGEEGQMLFTTHYNPLIKSVDDLIRKDNIWFMEKKEDGHSDLYSLIEFRGLNKMSPNSMLNAYRNGRFGAVPSID